MAKRGNCSTIYVMWPRDVRNASVVFAAHIGYFHGEFVLESCVLLDVCWYS